MDFCYVDEAGSADLLCQLIPDSTPLVVVAGLLVPGAESKNLVWNYLQLKKVFNPQLAKTKVQLSELISTEIKGADLRSDLRSGSHRRKRRAFGIIDKVFELVAQHNGRLIAHILIKDENVPIIDASSYPRSVRYVVKTFHEYLEERNEQGLVILDSRTKTKNTPNIHGITTQIYRSGGNPYPRLVESPVFGHSDSHVALQIVDILASAVLFPSACVAYSSAYEWNLHLHPDYEAIRTRYSPRIATLEYRYGATAASQKGGLTVATNDSSLDSRIFFSN